MYRHSIDTNILHVLKDRKCINVIGVVKRSCLFERRTYNRALKGRDCELLEKETASRSPGKVATSKTLFFFFLDRNMIGLTNLELGRDCLLLYPVDTRGNNGCGTRTIRWIYNQLNDYPERLLIGMHGILEGVCRIQPSVAALRLSGTRQRGKSAREKKKENKEGGQGVRAS